MSPIFFERGNPYTDLEVHAWAQVRESHRKQEEDQVQHLPSEGKKNRRSAIQLQEAQFFPEGASLGHERFCEGNLREEI